MKPFTILFLALVAAAGTSFLVYALMPPATARVDAAKAIDTSATDALAGSVDGLAKKQQALEKEIEDLRRDLAAQSGATRVPTGDIEAAVARALEKRAGETTIAMTDKPAKPATKTDVKAAFAKLSDPASDFGEWSNICAGITDEAALKELVQMFEQHAKEFPNDPKAQVQLGQAYLQKLFQTKNPMELGKYANLADKAFDSALAIDDHDWTARYIKSVSLSRWPASMGKQHETIDQLEILVKQQDSTAAQPFHAQSHLLLGNMYSQIGDQAKAMAAWKKGLALFPDDADLKKQIAAAEAH